MTVAPALPELMAMLHVGIRGIMVLLTGLMFVGRCHHPVPSSAAVELASGVADADQTVARDLVAAFDRAETAVQHADLDGLMPFYEEGYNYYGLKRSDVRRIWTEVFSHYGDITSRHVFTELKIVRDGSKTKAYVTCTGGLYGIDKGSRKPVTIDSWTGEVHHLVKDEGTWKFLGNVGGAPPDVPATSAPHHPLF
jgi:hypothetical protein